MTDRKMGTADNPFGLPKMPSTEELAVRRANLQAARDSAFAAIAASEAVWDRALGRETAPKPAVVS